MEPKPHNEYTDQIKADFERRQAAICDKLDLLLRNYELPTERLLDLYGPGIFDPSRPESAAIDRWLNLCDTLTMTDKSMVALVHARQPNYHACYPIDVPGKDRPILSITIVTDLQNAGISFYPEVGSTSAILTATGYRMIQPGPTTPLQPHFDNLNDEPKPIDPIIATQINSMNIIDNDLGDRFEIVVAGDTYRELYEAILAEYYSQHSFDSDPLANIELDPCMIRLIRSNLNETRRKRAAETTEN